MIELTSTPETLRDAVEERVRAEHEPAIQAEIERRMAAVEAALSGGIEPPPPPRKPRSDKGRPRAKAGEHVPDAREPGYVPPTVEERKGGWPDCTCGHPHAQHDGYTGCLHNGCACRSYHDSDPLGLEGYPQPEARQ